MENEDKLKKIIEAKNVSDSELTAIIDQIKNPKFSEKTYQHRWSDKVIRIGLCSDTHVGSKYFDLNATIDLFKKFKEAGVEAVYHCGDITEGYNMRPGHSFECSEHGADAQIDKVVADFPFIGKKITS